MTIAEQITRAKTDYDEVYTAGKQAEYDQFWDAFQSRGFRTDYTNCFRNPAWNDVTFKPKYKIKGKISSTFSGSNASRLEVDVEATGTQTHVFFGTPFEYIRNVIAYPTCTYTSWFGNCTKLTHVGFTGTIAKSISFNFSPLTPECMANIISNNLVDHYGAETGEEFIHTVKFNDACWEALEASELVVPNPECTWKQYVTDVLGWNV